MYLGKPIIGLSGGIGSGKSHVARIFGQMGCTVIDADELVRATYTLDAVKVCIRQWWGDTVFISDGSVDRQAVATKVFSDPCELRRLEELLHPLVAAERDRIMAAKASDPAVKAFVWDVPLLFETGLSQHCDALVFVQSHARERIHRVKAHRGWTEAELKKREKSQLPLDKKRKMSQYIVQNTSEADDLHAQVAQVLSRILLR